MAANKSIATFKLDRIRAAVWKNTGDNGIFCNVTIERNYLDGDQWKSSTSFGRLDLPLVAKVAEQAMTYTLNLVIVTGYLRKLIENVRVVRYLAQTYPEILAEFQKLADARNLHDGSAM